MVASSKGLVLVIDDDSDVRAASIKLLHTRGHDTLGAATVAEGLRLFQERRPVAVLLDMKLPDGTGNDVLRELQRIAPATPVVVISGYGNVGDAVQAMRVGAADYIEKPVSRERLFEVLDKILRRAPDRETDLDKADGSRYGMVGRSEPMRRIYQLIQMAAPTKCRVLISGDSGTGKELIARAIHALSPRRERPFVEVNCAAIPAELIESEMFGYMKGAFTGAFADRKGMFEAANGGTLFLDEIGDMALMTQTKLLRVLQENQVTPVGSSDSRPVDVRIISATSKHLLDEIARGTFRGDLYHRINVLAIAVPSLTARREDIAELAEHFLRLASVENGVKPKRLAVNAVELLKKLPWKGNVRELRNSMERVAVLITSDVVEAKNIADLVDNLDEKDETEDTTLPLREARNRFERQYILYRLSANSGNLGKTAQDLGIERTNLYRKMKQLGIQPTKARG